jgi:hypothetical protein
MPQEPVSMLIGSTDVSEREIREFSEKWRIVELALFGSVRSLGGK